MYSDKDQDHDLKVVIGGAIGIVVVLFIAFVGASL